MSELPIEQVAVGHVILAGPDRQVPCRVLRVEPGVETVQPLAGRPCIRLWCERTDTGDEGYVTFGPTALVSIEAA